MWIKHIKGCSCFINLIKFVLIQFGQFDEELKDCHSVMFPWYKTTTKKIITIGISQTTGASLEKKDYQLIHELLSPWTEVHLRPLSLISYLHFCHHVAGQLDFGKVPLANCLEQTVEADVRLLVWTGGNGVPAPRAQRAAGLAGCLVWATGPKWHMLEERERMRERRKLKNTTKTITRAHTTILKYWWSSVYNAFKPTTRTSWRVEMFLAGTIFSANKKKKKTQDYRYRTIIQELADTQA